MPCEHARKGCSEASNTDEDLEASPGGFACILRRLVRSTVRREDVVFPSDAQAEEVEVEEVVEEIIEEAPADGDDWE